MRRLLLLVLCLSVSAMGAPLQFWLVGESNERARILQEIIDQEFTAKTGLEVEITTFAWGDYDSRYLLAAASGDGPDISVQGSLAATNYGIRGAMLDLRKEFGERFEVLRSQVFPGLLASVEYRGTGFGLPFTTFVYPLYMRTDIMADYGLDRPVLWRDLQQMLPRMQAQGMNFALAWGVSGTVYADVSMFIWQHGGDWYSEDRLRSGLDDPRSIAGFTEYVELHTKYGIPLETVRFQAFRDGRVPIQQGSAYDYTRLHYASPELAGKWSMSVVPGTLRDGSIDHAAYIGGSTIGIFKSSKRYDEAFQFIEWVLSADVQGQYASRVINEIQGSLFFPSNFEAIQQLPFPDEHKAVLLEQAWVSRAPTFALAPESIVHRYIDFAVNRSLLQGVDPETAMREASRHLDQELRTKQMEFARFIQQLPQ